MPITPLEGIMYVNQNMHVPAAKQNDHQNRVEFQNVIAAARVNAKPSIVQDVGGMVESKAIDSEKEHQREEAETQTGEKQQEVFRYYEKRRKFVGEEELLESLPYHILDIRV